MSIIQLINQKDGSKAPVALNRGRAIRLRCLDCSGWIVSGVRKCEHKSCPLYPLRLGKKPEDMSGVERSCILVAYCRECCNGHPSEKAHCPADCPLFPYRYSGKVDRSFEINPTKRKGAI